jgi:hypothetical protein
MCGSARATGWASGSSRHRHLHEARRLSARRKPSITTGISTGPQPVRRLLGGSLLRRGWRSLTWFHLDQKFTGASTLAAAAPKPTTVYEFKDQNAVSLQLRARRNFWPRLTTIILRRHGGCAWQPPACESNLSRRDRASPAVQRRVVLRPCRSRGRYSFFLNSCCWAGISRTPWGRRSAIM